MPTIGPFKGTKLFEDEERAGLNLMHSFSRRSSSGAR